MANHCHDEHSHDHDTDGHGHDHTDDLTPALQTYLYRQVEFDKIVTLNELTPGSGAAVVKKGWEKRMEAEPELVSDTDEQLLIYVPFTGQTKLHSLLLRTSPSASAPQTVHLFINRDDLDFTTATQLIPTQTLTLSQTSEIQDVALKRALWNTTRCITLFIETNYGAGEEETTRISFLGFKGEWMPLNREPISVLYEAAANPNDHVPIVGMGNRLGSGIGGAGREGL